MGSMQAKGSDCAEPTCLIALPGVTKVSTYSWDILIIPNCSCKLMQTSLLLTLSGKALAE